MKKFRSNYGTRIDELEVVRETEKQVIYIRKEDGKETREAKISEWSSWHETKEDAVNYMISKEQLKIDSHNNQIKYCETNIETIRSLLNVV